MSLRLIGATVMLRNRAAGVYRETVLSADAKDIVYAAVPGGHVRLMANNDTSSSKYEWLEPSIVLANVQGYMRYKG